MAGFLLTLEAIAGLIFALTYLLFLAEMRSKTVAALLGAMLMVGFGVLGYTDIGGLIDYKTLAVALGMMIVVAVMAKSGLFEYLSIRAIKLSRGDPVRILIIMALLALPLTAIFDNITSSLVLGSIVITACTILGLDFVPYLIAIAIVINIGGLLTPVSDLPNMMITTAAGFGFLSFVWYILPLCIVLVGVTLLYFAVSLRKQLHARVRKTSVAELEALDENAAIHDPRLFRNSLIVLGLIILAFITHESLGIGVDVIALAGAIIMLVLSGADAEEVFKEVHWSTLAFLIGLFIVVGGVDKVGLLARFSSFVGTFARSELSAALVVLFSSTGMSSIINSIPVTAVFIPIVKQLSALISVNPTNIFYALVVAAGLGGNITPIGSSSTIIAAGFAEKHGRSIGFFDFFKIGFVLTLVHLAISALYFFIRIQLM